MAATAGCPDCAYCRAHRLVRTLGKFVAIRRCGECRHPLGRHVDGRTPGLLSDAGIDLANAQLNEQRRGPYG